MSAYRHFVSTKATVEMLFLKFLFLGPPRLGKTTALRRLMGEIVDLFTAGELDRYQPSTPAVELGHDMVVQGFTDMAAVIAGSNWSSVENLTDEARMLFQSLVDFADVQSEADVATPTSGAVVESAAAPTQAEPTPLVSRKQAEKPKVAMLMKFFSGLKFLKKREPKVSVPVDLAVSSPSKDIPEVVAIFKSVVEKQGLWKDMRHSFKAYLRLEDTGGQPELMDMLPLLTIGPGLYLLFFSYEWNLEEEFPVFYLNEAGQETPRETSTITLKEMLLSTLSSISCSNSSPGFTTAEEKSSSEMHHILESSNSVAFFVGTHRDRVSEEVVKEMDHQLQAVIRDTDFFEKNVMQFCSADQLVIAMDNARGGAAEVQKIRRMLERSMQKNFRKLKVPGVWLLFSLCLRKKEVRIISFQDCMELAALFNMDVSETKVALWFLHHHAGVLMFFPEVPVLSDLVIVDVQVVYDSITRIILQAMTFDKVGVATAEHFRNTGQFVVKDLVRATRGLSEELIPALKLVALLEFLHIIARIHTNRDAVESDGPSREEEEEEAVFIMPCVLRSASKELMDLVYADELRPQGIAPLMVRYKSGFLPLGVFPALISCLISSSSFRLIQEEVKKNLVKFYYGSGFALVSLAAHPKFIGIVVCQLPKGKQDMGVVCVELKNEIEALLDKVASRTNYGRFSEFQFAFECPSHPGREHLSVFEDREACPMAMLCMKNTKHPIPEDFNDCHRVWLQRKGGASGSVGELQGESSDKITVDCED